MFTHMASLGLKVVRLMIGSYGWNLEITLRIDLLIYEHLPYKQSFRLGPLVTQNNYTPLQCLIYTQP